MDLKIITKSINSFTALNRAKVMKASIALSVIFHLFLILGFQSAFPLVWNTGELRTYRVEFFRPPVNDTEAGDNPGNIMDNPGEKGDIPVETSQETISLDTKDKRYVEYTSQIKREIMGHWKYPQEARAYLIEGSLMVLFTLTDDGRMTGISITSSSGHDILDREVLRAINSSVPFPPFPASIKVKRLNINALFDYRLSSKKGNT